MKKKREIERTDETNVRGIKKHFPDIRGTVRAFDYPRLGKALSDVEGRMKGEMKPRRIIVRRRRARCGPRGTGLRGQFRSVVRLLEILLVSSFQEDRRISFSTSAYRQETTIEPAFSAWTRRAFVQGMLEGTRRRRKRRKRRTDASTGQRPSTGANKRSACPPPWTVLVNAVLSRYPRRELIKETMSTPLPLFQKRTKRITNRTSGVLRGARLDAMDDCSSFASV